MRPCSKAFRPSSSGCPTEFSRPGAWAPTLPVGSSSSSSRLAEKLHQEQSRTIALEPLLASASTVWNGRAYHNNKGPVNCTIVIALPASVYLEGVQSATSQSAVDKMAEVQHVGLQFWARPEDRVRFVSVVTGHGQVRNLEAELLRAFSSTSPTANGPPSN